MNPKTRVRIADFGVLLLIGWLTVPALMNRQPKSGPSEFAKTVDLEPLRNVAVHDVGRIKSFDSFAREAVRYISGGRKIEGQDPLFSYMDLMFNSTEYRDKKIIYVKKPIREAMARVMRQMDYDEAIVKSFLDNGQVSENTIRSPQMIDELVKLNGDVIRTVKFVNQVEMALFFVDPHTLSERWKIIPPPGGNDQTPWQAGEALWGLEHLGDGHHHAETGGKINGLDPQLDQTLRTEWDKLVSAWRNEDAPAASAAIQGLAGALARVEPSLYPQADKLQLESWYFRMKAFVWNWIVYVLAVVPLLLWVIYRWKEAFRFGAGITFIAFAIHTASLAIRWYLAGRIPNANMFEAILAATWFGVAGAFVLEIWVRKTALKGLFLLGSGICAMIAMMCQHFMPTTLQSDIDNVMPVLDDVWLYIHTNVIIWSYALIGMAAVTALLYLRYRLGGGDPGVAKAGGAGSLVLDSAPGKRESFLKSNRTTAGQVLDAATMVTMELSFVMLWAGLVMGAIWADHSWGRPWGWDPKEVFALCTFLIFMILVHVRFKVRDKGFWTAVLAVVGCGVMIFNWIVINFKIQGLHSYA
jgi:cytochrome c-type biogenesis protein CcsB